MTQLSDQPETNITQILEDVRHGVEGASEQLAAVVYDELRGIAQRIFNSQRASGKSIQPTILVHDVFMQLTGNTGKEWTSRSHFYAVAAKATRHLLVDQARRQQAAKRGGGWNQISLTGVDQRDKPEEMIEVLDLEDALRELGELAPRQEKIVEMRFYAGLTVEEVAEVLAVSPRTVLYDWRMARAWLRAKLGDEKA